MNPQGQGTFVVLDVPELTLWRKHKEKSPTFLHSILLVESEPGKIDVLLSESVSCRYQLLFGGIAIGQ